jgi:hypothetical protein
MIRSFFAQGMTNTGTGARLTSFCETLPSRSPATCPMPRRPTTIASACLSRAISMIAGAVSPPRDSSANRQL